MWGFGMRMAIWSGVLAAKDIVGECDYDQEIRKHLMPYVKTSIANRFLMNRVGDRMFKLMCNRWMKHQRKSGDGLIWIGKLFKPSLLKSSIYVLTSPFMLKKDTNSSSRYVRRLPFRKAKSRDNWEPSKARLMLEKGGTKSAEKVLRPHLKMILTQHLFRQNDNESLMMYFHLECLCPNYMVLTYSLCQTNW